MTASAILKTLHFEYNGVVMEAAGLLCSSCIEALEKESSLELDDMPNHHTIAVQKETGLTPEYLSFWFRHNPCEPAERDNCTVCQENQIVYWLDFYASLAVVESSPL